MIEATQVQSGEQAADPLEETQQNPDLPRLLAQRAARGLGHLNLDSAPTAETESERSAVRTALVCTAVLVAVVLVVATRVVALPHMGS